MVSALRETDLYAPIKALLEGQGYAVKGEVRDCDVVAVRGGEAPVIVELKTAFSLPLLFQGIQRQSLSDQVYLAFPLPKERGASSLWRRHHRDILKLCRLLGLGLITVRFRDGKADGTEIHLDPAPYRPRKQKRRQAMLLSEFERRVGDPSPGGANKRPVVTAYRQDALKCACLLDRAGPTKASKVKAATGVDTAARILQRDVYGWFHRVERGTYALTPAGERALATFSDVIKSLG